MPDTNKVLYGFSNLHVGTYTVAQDGTVTLGTPYHQKGAVGFAPEPQDEKSDFWADNQDYWSSYGGGQKEGDLTVAKFDDDFKTQFLGYVQITGGGIGEVRNPTKPKIYICFETQGDQGPIRVIMYNGTLGSINREYNTTEDTIEPQTESIPTVFVGDEATGLISAVYREGDAAYANFFTTPPAPSV